MLCRHLPKTTGHCLNMPTPNANNPIAVLAVTSQLPWPLNSGGHLRTYYLLRSMSQRFRVHLVTTTDDESEPGLAEFKEMGIQTTTISRTDTSLGNFSRSISCGLRGRPYVLYGRHERKRLRQLLIREIAASPPDVLYLDHLDSYVYRSLGRSIPTVLDLHNVYSVLTDRLADEKSQPLRWYLKREAKLLSKVERTASLDTLSVLTVSSQEKEHFENLGAKNCWLAPNGVDCEKYADLPTSRDPNRPPVILHLGAMSWEPNVEAAEFLARQVVPELRKQVDNLQLKIVGKNPTSRVLALGKLPGVEVAGSVPDVKPYLIEADLLAVPLNSGGGTRLKILEAFAAGLPVLSTSVGCEGIQGKPGEHLMVATREKWVSATLDFLKSSSQRLKLADNARRLARDQYDWGAIGAEVCGVVTRLARGQDVAER